MKYIFKISSLVVLAASATGLTLLPIPNLQGETGVAGSTIPQLQDQSSFLWSANVGDYVYTANFTVSHPDEGKKLLALDTEDPNIITCDDEGISLRFDGDDALASASTAWAWVNDNISNSITLVSRACAGPGERSLHLVHSLHADASRGTITFQSSRTTWAQIAQESEFQLQSQTREASIRWPGRFDRLMPIPINHTFDGNLFHFGKDSDRTAGLDLSADASLVLGGQLLLEVHFKKSFTHESEYSLTVHPDGTHASVMLALTANGRLGKELLFDGPNIDLPVYGITVPGLAHIGPFVHAGIHFGATGLEGVATTSIGAKAAFRDSAFLTVDFGEGNDHVRQGGWVPDLEKVDPQLSAELSASLRAWVELGFGAEATILDHGFETAISAQVPYIEANMAARFDTSGVCDSNKTKGVEVDAGAGVSLGIHAGIKDEVPLVSKEILQTRWPLYSTCIGIGDEDARMGRMATAFRKTTRPTGRGTRTVPPTAPTRSAVASRSSKVVSPTPSETSSAPPVSPPTAPPSSSSPAASSAASASSAPDDVPTTRSWASPSLPAVPSTASAPWASSIRQGASSSASSTTYMTRTAVQSAAPSLPSRRNTSTGRQSSFLNSTRATGFPTSKGCLDGNQTYPTSAMSTAHSLVHVV